MKSWQSGLGMSPSLYNYCHHAQPQLVRPATCNDQNTFSTAGEIAHLGLPFHYKGDVVHCSNTLDFYFSPEPCMMVVLMDWAGQGEI